MRVASEVLDAPHVAVPAAALGGHRLRGRETTEVYARLFVQLRQAGTPIPTNDLWIASLAIHHQFTLLSRDKYFAQVGQVSVL